MSIFSKITTIVKAHTNDVLDRHVDQNSPIMIRQYIVDLETALSDAKHQAAVAAATVTTLKGQKADLEKSITDDTARAKAYVAQGNTDAARVVGIRVVDNRKRSSDLDASIATAISNSQQMDAAVSKVDAKHTEMLNQYRTLQTQDGNAKALAGLTKSLQNASNAANSVSSDSIDNLAQRIRATNDVATEEFNRTVADPAFSTPDDPLKAAAVDDFLKGL